MRDIRVAAGQFEHRDGDKAYNLSRVAELTARAAAEGAEVVSFHECCLTGYTFLQGLSRSEVAALAEPVPGGASVAALAELARRHKVVVLAGLIESAPDGRLHNTYAAVGPDGVLGRHRKLHAFISPHIESGDAHTVVALRGMKAGICTCYDNNLPENPRVAALMGAEVLFMPHVTGCLPSPMPGRGTVDPALWENRRRDPVRLRMEFDGPKGRGWLMKFLPARAFENGVYVVFTNPIGVDGDTIKNGNAMVLDPFGEVLDECRALGDDVVTALLTAEKLQQASGRRYLRARRPDLYAKLVEPPPPGQQPVTRPGWKRAFDADGGQEPEAGSRE